MIRVRKKLIYFDMTDIYRKLGKSREKKQEKDIKRLIEDHKPLEKSQPNPCDGFVPHRGTLR